jgi:hypothetical protein
LASSECNQDPFEALVGAMFTFALATGILLMGDDLEALEEALET